MAAGDAAYAWADFGKQRAGVARLIELVQREGLREGIHAALAQRADDEDVGGNGGSPDCERVEDDN